MKKPDLGQTITIIANIGVIGGILLLAYELRQNNLHLQEQTRFNLFQNRLGANEFIAENEEIADLWYWQEGDDPLTSVEERRLRGLIHTWFLRWQYDYGSVQLGTVEMQDFPVVAIRATWRDRPIFEEVWEGRKVGYSPNFVEWMEQNVVGVAE